MSDPLTDVVELLQPHAVFANLISGKGNWSVRYAEYGQPSFCVMLEGACLLAVDGHEPVRIGAGDFVLLPATPAFTISSEVPAPPVHLDPHAVGGGGEVRYGEQGGTPEMRSLGGAFLFGDAGPGLLVSLLPGVVHVRDSARLAQLVRMVGDEHAARQPGHAFMLSRLAGMMLVEAMRSTAAGGAPPGLLRGLGDERLAGALRQLHADVARAWTIGELASAAALSRSAFFDRFTRTVGVAPMAYLVGWRMELAKGLLRRGELSVADIAERVGYASTSAFSTAFSRCVGDSPRRYARCG
jgi:AraC-like DNA-binding protein